MPGVWYEQVRLRADRRRLSSDPSPTMDGTSRRAAAEAVTSLLLIKHHSPVVAASHLRTAAQSLRSAHQARFAQTMLMTGGPGAVMFPIFRLSRSALVAVWDDESALERFLAGPTYAAWKKPADELLLVRLRPTRVKGTWDGRSPFWPAARATRDSGPLAVFTRVAVRSRFLPAFYGSALPPIAMQIDRTPGALLSVGLTERPIRIGATFSIWCSLREMQRYGYHAPPHGAVQRRAREQGWFDEELFVRFQVLHADGCWLGRRFSGAVSDKL
jgi:hypothetical protein